MNPDKILYRPLTDRQKWVLENLNHVHLRDTPFYHEPLWCIGRKVVSDALKSLVARRLIKLDKSIGEWVTAGPDLVAAALDDSLYAMI